MVKTITQTSVHGTNFYNGQERENDGYDKDLVEEARKALNGDALSEMFLKDPPTYKELAAADTKEKVYELLKRVLSPKGHEEFMKVVKENEDE